MSKGYGWGLDLSLSNTGVTIFDLELLKPVFIGSVCTDKVKKKRDLYHNALKLKHIGEYLMNLAVKYPPEVIIIERGFSRFNASTQTIFRVHGLCNYLFYNVNQIYYPPKAIKEAVIKGDATKKQVANSIQVKYPDIEFADEDQSDSFAIILTYLIKEGLIKWDKPRASEISKTKKMKKEKAEKK